jgi:hypothetical protein
MAVVSDFAMHLKHKGLLGKISCRFQMHSLSESKYVLIQVNKSDKRSNTVMVNKDFFG